MSQPLSDEDKRALFEKLDRVLDEIGTRPVEYARACTYVEKLVTERAGDSDDASGLIDMTEREIAGILSGHRAA
ncbi:hypothetical protein [Asticcacaulis machinosus]|uniref:Uncharacterized protein n=1 Tax=Asticcacaulis machinosus TaxID=2984211 RepID=A0ABT5HMH1_9CAUL|nr:hypothetical protein [Asticcacaulis machinosus]MDC7677444.1 hypothetical protein [Asticcacaulis machinosus]